MSSRETGLRFTLYLGDLGTQTRTRAEELHAQLRRRHLAERCSSPSRPGQRVVEVVTGAAAARRLPDRACALAVLSMTGRSPPATWWAASSTGCGRCRTRPATPAALRHPY